jgi:hypothetical protein
MASIGMHIPIVAIGVGSRSNNIKGLIFMWRRDNATLRPCGANVISNAAQRIPPVRHCAPLAQKNANRELLEAPLHIVDADEIKQYDA